MQYGNDLYTAFITSDHMPLHTKPKNLTPRTKTTSEEDDKANGMHQCQQSLLITGITPLNNQEWDAYLHHQL